MRPSLALHATRQHGLVTRGQALSAGYTAQEIRGLTRPDGEWVIVRRGVYLRRDLWDAAGDWSDKPLLRALAAHLVMERPHVLSHTSAGLLHRLPMLHPGNDLIHVTRPGVTGSRTRHGVKHHLAGFRPEQVVTIDGVEALDLARTAVDIGRELGYQHGLVACDAALQRGITKTELQSTLDVMTDWPHVTKARAAVEDSNPGAESIGETLAREVVQSLGLGPVQTQFSVQVPGAVHFVDMRVGRHLIEFDGKVKYLGRDAGGLADRAPEEVVWLEKQRQDAICAEGYGMSRLVWGDVWGAARRQTADRLRREIERTTQRFGTELPAGYTPVTRRRTKSLVA